VYFSEEGVVTLSIMEPLGPLLKQNVTTFPKDVKEYLFNLTLSFIRQKEDRADLWRKDLIELAKKLTDSKEKAEILIDTLLSLYDRNSWIDDVLQELFELISKWKTADELDKFIDSHLDSDYIRKTAIDRVLMLKNYSGAVAMIKEKITGSSDYDFYLTSWYEMLLAIAQQINDENTILQCAKYLLIHTRNNDKDYFDLIRKYTAPSKLNNTIDGIIKEINSNFDKRKAYNIYIYGEMWNKLMDYVKKS